MFTTQAIFTTLFNSIPYSWTNPKPNPTLQHKHNSLYTYHIEDYHTHF